MGRGTAAAFPTAMWPHSSPHALDLLVAKHSCTCSTLWLSDMGDAYAHW